MKKATELPKKRKKIKIVKEEIVEPIGNYIVVYSLTREEKEKEGIADAKILKEIIRYAKFQRLPSARRFGRKRFKIRTFKSLTTRRGTLLPI